MIWRAVAGQLANPLFKLHAARVGWFHQGVQLRANEAQIQLKRTPRWSNTDTSASRASSRVGPLGGEESFEVGTQLLPLAFPGGGDAQAALSRRRVGRRHGARGI